MSGPEQGQDHPPDPQDLVEDYFMGRLSAEEAARLQELLVQDPALRDDFRHAAELEDGRKVTEDLVLRILAEELLHLQGELSEDTARAEQAAVAADLFGQLVTSAHFHEFLTLPAYEQIRRDRP